MAGSKGDLLSNVLPPLIFGTATFNNQYNKDPYALDTQGLVSEALHHGIRAFDSSPYYGPAEELLGKALAAPDVVKNYPRNEYFLLTKVGRISASEFDYSPEWVRKSVARSLERLNTRYLDVVYCHDVEFVTPDEVVAAVKELRRIRDEQGTVKYIGISGYPLETLCSLAERISKDTGLPLDIVMSYANYTLQNRSLAQTGVARLQAAGVDVVANASLLGMGLLRSDGPPVGSKGDWHPAPIGLRNAVRTAATFCAAHGESLEVIALRYALESWLSAGGAVGTRGGSTSRDGSGARRIGVSVMGVSHGAELQKTMMVWWSILDGREDGREIAQRPAGRWSKAREWSLNRRDAVQLLGEGVRDCLGEWCEYAWSSPPPEYVHATKTREMEKGER
jgi:aryl-alcohol dehydrogenase-like predicted oxidoreductase